MSVVERLFMAAFVLIGIYVVLNAQQAGSVIGSLGQYTGGIFGTLQGANVTFPGATGSGSGVQISRPNVGY